MKFTLSWLREHLDTDADAAALAAAMTRVGLEVESVTNPADALRPFRVARVLSAAPHPQADKLQVLSVDTGAGEPLQVVCGAPNARAGLVGVFGGPGTHVPGLDVTLKKAAIRGVESNGMMCSRRELLLGEDHDGIIELADDAPVGASFAEVAGVDDPLFDVAITPNRPDCMGVEGIARDLAALGIGTLRARPVAAIAGEGAPGVGVAIAPGSGCWTFWRREVRGLTNGPSPQWLQQRLKAVGLRPISALVDITNFFTLDRARPLHVYDLAKLTGDIVVRRGREGDRFDALNDKAYAPADGDIVIADGSGAIGLGGIVGGESTGVDQGTTDVLLECAWFDPSAIARTGQRHMIATDARARFERGIDPEAMEAALDAATAMILELCGGTASEAAVVHDHPPATRRSLAYRPQRLAELAGLDLDEAEQRAILARLGFASAADGTVAIPSFRPDIDGEADLVEEIARIHGYDRIPSTPLPRDFGVAPATASRAQLVERRVRRAAAARGLDEAITWSFIAEREAALFGGGAHVLANPISTDMKVMRPSLVPGLAAAARRNLDRGAKSVRLFEVGRRYLAEGERPTLGLLLAGERQPRGWASGKAQGFDAFDAKADVLALLDAAGAPTANLQLAMDAGPHWHPGRSASLGLGPKTILARFGELHPRLAKALDLPAGTVAGEMYLDALPAPRSSERARPAFAPPALMPLTRDFAFLVPDDLAAEALVRAVRGADKALIADVRLFDRYAGEQGLSYALEVLVQPLDKTLGEAEIAELSAKIVAAAGKLGASLRG